MILDSSIGRFIADMKHSAGGCATHSRALPWSHLTAPEKLTIVATMIPFPGAASWLQWRTLKRVQLRNLG